MTPLSFTSDSFLSFLFIAIQCLKSRNSKSQQILMIFSQNSGHTLLAFTIKWWMEMDCLSIMMLLQAISAVGFGKWPCFHRSPLTILSERPINDEGKLVAPSDFSEYRLTHDFWAPSCLCALADEGKEQYTELAVLLCAIGEFASKYVATCATDHCGYLSSPFWFMCESTYWFCTSVSVARMYTSTSLGLYKYPLRGQSSFPGCTRTDWEPSLQMRALLRRHP